MKTIPFSSGCGTLVSDIQLAQLSSKEIDQLRDLFFQKGLLFFRDQILSEEQHLHFAKDFGDIVVNKFFKTTQDHPEIALVLKEKDQQTNIGNGWHADHSYDKEPAMGSMLVARELPTQGGDTHFANLYAAYEALSPGLQKTLESMNAIHSNKHLYGEKGYYRSTDLADQLGGADQVGNAIHPVVIVHPQSKRKALYINPGHTIKFEGWTSAESRPLMDFLYTHVSQPQFTCRFNWLPGSITLWDNRCSWHLAENDYQGEKRLMHRITLAGSPLHGADDIS